ncbi:hypothetical protein [Acidimicrobium ferrooxidans]|uniref:hypothetical protein n=1 Tax=Acidimicrobium ferrooxidans TaxID=53635 RepID=UPI0005A1882E|nr:hypothetical protein [Acidimicrobium ferrooxidans]
MAAVVAVAAPRGAKHHHHTQHLFMPSPTGGQPIEAPTSRHTIWLLAEAHFDQVVSVAPVRALFARGVVYEPITPRQHPSTLVPVIPTADFHAESQLAQAIADHELATGVRAVIYDNERFANTPTVEQDNIRLSTERAAAVARAAGLQSICDFIESDRLPSGERTAQNEVPPCSIVGLNTVQQSERSTARYRAVVARDVAVIRSVDPSVPIIAGLSSNPRGTPVTAAELTADMEATAGLVNGYWLNVPAPGVGCPACHAPDPGLMAEALAALPAGFATTG